MSVEFAGSEVPSSIEDPVKVRRRVLLGLARAQNLDRPMQVVIDAEVLLDGSKLEAELYHWTKSERRIANELKRMYLDLDAVDSDYTEDRSESGETVREDFEDDKPDIDDQLVTECLHPQAEAEKTEASVKPKASSTLKKLLQRVQYKDVSHLIDPSLVRTTEWIGRSACRGMDFTLFDVPDGETRAFTSERARQLHKVCGGCTVRAACLTDVVVNGSTHIIRLAQPPHVLKSWEKQYKDSLKPKIA